jgi:hypothetical protein
VGAGANVAPAPAARLPGGAVADDRSLALAAAHAERREGAPGVAALHLVQQGDEDPPAAGPDRMSQGDRAAVCVDPLGVGLEFAQRRKRRRRERLVELDRSISPSSSPVLCARRSRSRSTRVREVEGRPDEERLPSLAFDTRGTTRVRRPGRTRPRRPCYAPKQVLGHTVRPPDGGAYGPCLRASISNSREHRNRRSSCRRAAVLGANDGTCRPRYWCRAWQRPARRAS